MPPADLDALFGDGAELGQGVVVKAQLRFRVHPPRHLAARDLVDRMVAAYDERLAMIIDEVVETIQIAEVARDIDHGPSSPPLVLALAKAVPRAPFRPGSRGGKWYRDAKGNIRYGDPPEGKFMGNSGASPSPPPELDHLRAGSFMGAFGRDQELTSFLVERGGEHGFTGGELRFLTAWYGTHEEGGALFDAFLECAGITRDDLKNGVTNLRFGSQQLTYAEAVFEFFAAQEDLFMGDGSESGDQDGGWDHVLNDEIKPLLDGVFTKYEMLKDDVTLQQRFAGEPARQRRRFFDAARRSDEDMRQFADSVVGDWDPRRQLDVAVAGLRALGMFARPARAERAAYVHGRPHLRDAVAMDGRLLVDGSDNPLLEDKDELGSLSSSQLMLLYVAAELHRRWDPHSKSFSTEKQVEVGATDLGEAAFAALAGKTDGWAGAAARARDRLEELVDLIVVRLNRVNAREGTPVKHGPTKKPRSRK